MNLSELKNGMSNVTVKGKVIDVSQPREVNTKFGSNTVAEATLQDATGTIKLSLWGKQIGLVDIGDEVEVVNGYVKEWRDQLQLSVSMKTGEIKKV